MLSQRTRDRSLTHKNNGFRPELLFMVAICVLILMSTALSPSLALPVAAFVVMTSVTWHLGLRLYDDLTHGVDRDC